MPKLNRRRRRRWWCRRSGLHSHFLTLEISNLNERRKQRLILTGLVVVHDRHLKHHCRIRSRASRVVSKLGWLGNESKRSEKGSGIILLCKRERERTIMWRLYNKISYFSWFLLNKYVIICQYFILSFLERPPFWPYQCCCCCSLFSASQPRHHNHHNNNTPQSLVST